MRLDSRTSFFMQNYYLFIGEIQIIDKMGRIQWIDEATLSIRKKSWFFDDKLEWFDFWFFLKWNFTYQQPLALNWVRWTQKNDAFVLLGIRAQAMCVEHIFQFFFKNHPKILGNVCSVLFRYNNAFGSGLGDFFYFYL